MKRAFIWTVSISFILLLCLILVLQLRFLYLNIYGTPSAQSPALEPTPTITPMVVVAATPIPPTVTFTPTSPPTPTETSTPTPLPTATLTPVPIVPQVIANAVVNIRSGPGTNYAVIGTLSPGIALPVIGRNEAATWWQVQQDNGAAGWVAASVVQAGDVAGVPIAQAPPPIEPTATTVVQPTAAPAPAFQYEPTGWYDDTNAGLTRFLGNITDINGEPVNGVTVEAQCGTYRVISNPSGPVPAFDSADSANDPPGFYDITIDRKPVPCKWQLTVVHTEDGKTVLGKLSDTFEVEVTMNKSIIVANWRKNW